MVLMAMRFLAFLPTAYGERHLQGRNACDFLGAEFKVALVPIPHVHMKSASLSTQPPERVRVQSSAFEQPRQAAARIDGLGRFKRRRTIRNWLAVIPPALIDVPRFVLPGQYQSGAGLRLARREPLAPQIENRKEFDHPRLFG
jgi:hypothetical protein